MPYGVPDERGEVIREGCFRKSIKDSGGTFPCLWTHDPLSVLGTIKVESDTRTLAVTGALLLDVVPKAKEVHGLLKARAVRGLSVGFLPLRVEPRKDGGVDYVEGRLVEVSLCATPAYVGAQVSEVRSLQPSQDELTLVLKAITFDAAK